MCLLSYQTDGVPDAAAGDQGLPVPSAMVVFWF